MPLNKLACVFCVVQYSEGKLIMGIIFETFSKIWPIWHDIHTATICTCMHVEFTFYLLN